MLPRKGSSPPREKRQLGLSAFGIGSLASGVNSVIGRSSHSLARLCTVPSKPKRSVGRPRLRPVPAVLDAAEQQRRLEEQCEQEKEKQQQLQQQEKEGR